MDDKLLFEQAFKIQGKSFKRIQQMLLEKSVGSLVQHYYSQTRSRLMNMQTRKHSVVREDSSVQPVTSGERVVEGLGGGVVEDRPMGTGWHKVSSLSQGQTKTESPSRRLGSCSHLPPYQVEQWARGILRYMQLDLDSDALFGYVLTRETG